VKITERCSCSAEFNVHAEASDALGAVVGWRNTHRHAEVGAEVEEEADD
jgi:hypothetical protein